MAERPLPPKEYSELLAGLVQYEPIRAVMELRARGWSHLYGSEFSYVVADPTGVWACKANRLPDHGYETFAEIAVEPGVRWPHEPHIVWHRKAETGKGSLTLLERLQPLTGESRLLRHQAAIKRGAQMQYDYLTAKVVLKGVGSMDEIHRAMALPEQDEPLARLAAMLGAVMTATPTYLERWGRGDVMLRADGTEVLVDPFQRIPKTMADQLVKKSA